MKLPAAPDSATGQTDKDLDRSGVFHQQSQTLSSDVPECVVTTPGLLSEMVWDKGHSCFIAHATFSNEYNKPLFKKKLRHSFLCKFYILLKFLAATKSICPGALELSGKARGEFLACSIADP